MANSRFEKKEQKKITCSMGGNETEIDFVMVSKAIVFKRLAFKRCESHPLGIATLAGGNRYRQKKIEEGCEE